MTVSTYSIMAFNDAVVNLIIGDGPDRLTCDCDEYGKNYYCRHMRLVINADKDGTKPLGPQVLVPVFPRNVSFMGTPLYMDSIVSCVPSNELENFYHCFVNGDEVGNVVVEDLGFVPFGVGRGSIRGMIIDWLLSVSEIPVCHASTHTDLLFDHAKSFFSGDPKPDRAKLMDRVRMIDTYEILVHDMCRLCREDFLTGIGED